MCLKMLSVKCRHMLSRPQCSNSLRNIVENLPIFYSAPWPLAARHRVPEHPQTQGIFHWTGNVVILTKCSSLAALKVVILTTLGAASDENFVKMTFSVQCLEKRDLGVKLFTADCTQFILSRLRVIITLMPIVHFKCNQLCFVCLNYELIIANIFIFYVYIDVRFVYDNLWMYAGSLFTKQ